MTGLALLWLPILLSAVFVFFASFVIHMVLPWHKGDYSTVPNEDKLRDAIRPLAIPAGDYMVPKPSTRQDLQSPAFKDKVNAGPNLIMTVMPTGPMSMGQNLAMWFVYCLTVSFLAAFMAGPAVEPGGPSKAVFHFASLTAFTGYSAALWQASIWYRRSWWTTFKSTVDGLIYGVITGATFMWLWP